MQRLKRYQAPTHEDAYVRIREECGSEVEIVSTRNVRMPGLFGAPEREYVEVVVRVSDEELERRQKLAARLAAARAEAVHQRAHEAVRARAAHAGPPDDFDASALTDDDGYGDDDSALGDERSVPAAELAAAVAGEGPASWEELDLAPEFVNDDAGRGVFADGLLPSELLDALRPAGALDRADDMNAFDADDARDEIEDDVYARGPFATMNAAAERSYDDVAAAHRGGAGSAATAGSSSVGAAEFRALAEQVGEMKTMLRELMLERMRGGADDAPGALATARARLIERGVSATVAVPVLDQAAQGLPRNPDEQSVLRTIERKLAAHLPAVPRVDFARRPVVIFLVGPSGAGKTTFAVRLALDIRAHSLSATVAGTDVGRAGAPQQITALGTATGVPVQLCYAPGELQSLVNEGGSDVVIVDTPGHTGARRDRMTELEAFMQATRRRHTLLVLPATMQAADLLAVAKAYQPLGLEGLVLTRCDETATFGAIASTAVASGVGIAYTTHADGVSVAPRGGDNLMLARAVMTGQWPEPAAALGRGRGARTGARAG